MVGESADIVVVGGGLEGLSAAWALAERNAGNVLVLERGRICSGATVKSSGIVRCHYGVPSLAKMAWFGVQFFELADDVLGTDIGFFQTGYVVGVGAGDEEAIKANVSMQRALGIEVRLLEKSEAEALWPQADLSDFSAFAYEPRGGYGDAYLTGRAYASAAQRNGARIREHCGVESIFLDKASGRVAGVTTTHGDLIMCDAVVLAAGPWSVALARPLGVELPIKAQREQILLIDPGEEIVDAPVFSDLVNLQYIRTERSGQLLVGNSDHHHPEYADPDHYLDKADDAFIETAVEKVDRLLPRLPAPGLAYSYAGCYDVTPDFNPIIGESPIEGLYLCAGFSGHGFKISRAVGMLVAEIMCGGLGLDADILASDFALERFEEGRLLRGRHPYRAAAQMR